MIDGLLFDIDGTLWDSTNSCAIGYNRVIAEEPDIDLHVSGSILKPLFGRPVPEIGAALFSSLSDERREDIFARCLVQEGIALREFPPDLYAGAAELLPELAKKMPLYIISNCHAGYAELFLEVTGTEAFFSGHFCPDDNGKTKAENIRYVREKYGLKNTFYVGDTERDERASREAGTPFIYAAYGFGKAVAPDLVINTFDELKMFLR